MGVSDISSKWKCEAADLGSSVRSAFLGMCLQTSLRKYLNAVMESIDTHLFLIILIFVIKIN
jgi:hypothetical protein